MRINRRKVENQMELTLDVPWVSPLCQADDTALAAAAATQPEALAELFERYYDRVFRYVYHRVSNRWDAEDITSLVFVRVAESLPGFQPDRGTFAPWLFRIARNAIIDMYRRRRFTTHFAHDLDDMSDEHCDQHLHLTLDREHLEAGLAVLPDDQRDVIVLRFIADLDYDEIGAIMSRTEPAIRMLVHRGLRRLRQVYEGDESERSGA